MTTDVINSGLRVTDSAGNDYTFDLMSTSQGGQGFTLQAEPWEPVDPARRWRIPIHPFTGGLNVDRLHSNPTTYAKANADASYPNILLFPPKVNQLTMSNGDGSVITPVFFNGLSFWIGGRYAYYYDPSANTVTEDKDFGVGKAAVHGVVFNNELIVAMGESEKIYKRTTAGTWTQATDDVYAIALAVSGAPGQGNYVLWRAHDTNQVDSTTTSPLTLVNYTPADPNEYLVGDTSYAIYDMLDYGGVVWIRKGDGLYAPDAQGRFKNQSPQIAKTPSTDNGHRMFVAQGALWVPAVDGLYRIRPGKSHKRGPEITFRPNYRFRVRNGVEYGDFIYLIVSDSGTNESSFICKMNTDEKSAPEGHEYVYQEWARLPGTSVGYAISVNTAATNPKLCGTYGSTTCWYLPLGRGGGRDADDSNYEFGTSLIVETGGMLVNQDLAEVSTLVGVDVVADFSRANESLSVAYRWDPLIGSESYTDLLTTSEGGGTAAITTSGLDKVSRFASANVQGKMLELKLTGTLSSTTKGTTRPVIREVWAYGYTHPTHTDVISVGIVLDDVPNFTGGRVGAIETERLFRDWQNEGMEVIGELHGYERSRNTRFLIRKVERVSVNSTVGVHPGARTNLEQLKVQLVRVDRAGAYAD